MKSLSWIFCFVSVFCIAGCNNSTPMSQTVSISQFGPLEAPQFGKMFNDETAYTCVWYCGYDSTCNYFCFEHWTLAADGSSGNCDLRQLYKVNIAAMSVPDPFRFSSNQDEWQLMRPDPKEFKGKRNMTPRTKMGAPVIP